jgi:hypothetical protein
VRFPGLFDDDLPDARDFQQLIANGRGVPA